jgi:hypothetical protein
MHTDRKPFGRAPAAKVLVHPTTKDCQLVKFTATNGESYQINVEGMYQVNLLSGKRRVIRRRGGKWSFDRSSRRRHEDEYFWSAYPLKLQLVLEAAFQSHCSIVDASEINGTICNGPRCPKGHKMISDHRWNHTCDMCEEVGTELRCTKDCDYDICRQCFDAAQVDNTCTHRMGHVSRSSTAKTEQDISTADLAASYKGILTSSVCPFDAINMLRTLWQNRQLPFSAEDARHAALSIGSVAVLRIILCTGPGVQLLGVEIFDRRYPGFVLTDGTKSCIRMLLTRGAWLGRFAPASKLLRKIEADELPVWAQRYLNSMANVDMDVPDPLRHRIVSFLM